ncbi:MAG: ribbon-helix-helix protein, CopG family [Acidobacteria bacterium]|nr:ribbon-helix-helix protein, CopG family [Acidobacteriota bacterium]
MANRNITLSLPVELIKKAKVHAAEHEMSMNALIRALLEEKLDEKDSAWRAAEWLIERSKRGPYFSIDPSKISREELHERTR